MVEVMVVMVVVAVVGIGVVVGASGWEDKHVTNTRGRRQMSQTKSNKGKEKVRDAVAAPLHR